MPLGTEVGLGPGDIGDPAIPTGRDTAAPFFRPCLLWHGQTVEHLSYTAELLSSIVEQKEQNTTIYYVLVITTEFHAKRTTFYSFAQMKRQNNIAVLNSIMK